jgi:hypothetical protein
MSTLEDKAVRALALGASPEEINALLHTPSQINRVAGVLPVSGETLAGNAVEQGLAPIPLPDAQAPAPEVQAPAVQAPNPSVQAEIEAFNQFQPPSVEQEIAAFNQFNLRPNFSVFQQQADISVPEQGLIGAEWGRGVATLKADFARTGALIAGLFPGEDAAAIEQDWLRFAQEKDDYASTLPNYVKNFEELDTAGDYGTFIAGNLVRNAPMLLSLAIPGGAGRFIGARTAAAFGAGQAGIRRAGIATGVGSAVASDFGILTGETAGGIIEQGDGLEGNRGTIALTGSMKTVLDFAPWYALARKMGLMRSVDRATTAALVEKGFLKRAGNNMATLLATEVPTETMQELLDIITENVISEAEEQGLNQEDISRLKNAAAGAATFSFLGIPAAMFKPIVRDDRVPDVDARGEGGEQLALPPPNPPGTPLLPGPGTQAQLISPEQFDRNRSGFDWKDFSLGDSAFDINDPYFFEQTDNEILAGGLPIPIVGEETAGPSQRDYQLAQHAGDRVAILTNEGIGEVPQSERDDAEAALIQATIEPVNRTPAQDFLVFQARKRDIQRRRAALSIRRAPSTAFTGPLTARGLQSDIALGRDVGQAPTRQSRLESLIQRMLNDEKNYRKKDGKLKVAIGKKVARLEKQIADLQEQQPSAAQERVTPTAPAAPAVLPTQATPEPEVAAPAEAVEARDEDAPGRLTPPGTIETAAPEPTPLPNLSEMENKLLNRLEAKEPFEGLSENEYATLEKLQAKAAGEVAAPRQGRVTDAQVGELATELEEGTAGERQAFEQTRESRATEEGEGLPSSVIAKIIAPLERIFGIEVNVSAVKNMPIRLFGRRTHMDARGIYRENSPESGLPAREIWLVSDNIHTTKQAIETYLHEVVGHYGIRTVFSDAELATLQRLSGKKTQRELEEYIAAVAENEHLNPGFLAKVVAFFKRSLRSMGINVKLGKSEVSLILRDTREALKGRVINKYSPRKLESTTEGAEGESPTVTMYKAVGAVGGEQMEADTIKWQSLWEIKIGQHLYTPIQMVKRFGRHASEAGSYLRTVEEWWNTKVGIMGEANPVAEAWNKLPDVQGKRLGEALFEVSIESEKLNRRLTPEETSKILNKLKLSPEAQHIYYGVSKSFVDTINRLESGLKYNAIREHMDSAERAREFLNRWDAAIGNTDAQLDLFQEFALEGEALEGSTLSGTLKSIHNDMQIMKNRNYFPRMRFGQNAVVIRALHDDVVYQGEKFIQNQIVSFETFESANPAKSRVEEINKTLPPGFSVKFTIMKDTEFSFVGMPPGLLNTINTELDLDAEQKQDLKEIFIRVSPGRAFLRHLIQRRGVAGFSADAQRVYATYMLNASNHIARVEHYKDMQVHLEDMESRRKGYDPVATKAARELNPGAAAQVASGVDTQRVGLMANYFNKHYKYIMNPGNDLAKLRAMGFMWYLGFNAKSAVVNLSQVPLVTYPYLGERFGDARALNAIRQAMPAAAKLVTGKGKHGLSPEILEVVTRLTESGLLDESIATELAGFSESTVLERMIPKTAIGRNYNQLSLWSAWMFRHAEKYNRHVTAIAAAKLVLEGSSTEARANIDEAYLMAKDAIQSTQFEYAKWNRPEFMRGKKSVFFLFWQYMQHATFLAAGGQGAGTAGRFWLLLVLAAGLQGLPFAENLLDIIDFSSTQAKKLTGSDDPHTDTRLALRELLNSMTENNDMTEGIMHGMSRYYGMGPLHAMEAFGVPVPNTDVSGSLSLGRIVPGLEDMLGQARSPEEKFGRAIVEAMGPVLGVPYAVWRSMNDTNPDSWKKWERAMPVVLKSASRAMRIAERGEETARGGGQVLEYDPTDIDQRTELIAQALGFSPTRLGQAYELNSAQMHAQKWYSTRRSLLLEDYVYARMHGKRRMMADVKREIRMFNHSAPTGKIAITPQTMAKSWQERNRRARLRTAGQPSAKMYRGLYREIEEVFPAQ